MGFDRAAVERVARLVRINEYKRRRRRWASASRRAASARIGAILLPANSGA